MTPLRRLTLAVSVGVLAGAGGIGVTLVLHGTQHLLFGYGSGTFLEGIESAPAWRRVAGACAGGLVVGLGWAWVRRSGRPATVSDALHRAVPLPIVRTGVDALLQAVAVGGGASVGREGAPRQVGGAAGAQLADRLGVPPIDRRVLIAAGAGGGLAAVYNVPVAGVIFAALTLAAVARTSPPQAPSPDESPDTPSANAPSPNTAPPDTASPDAPSPNAAPPKTPSPDTPSPNHPPPADAVDPPAPATRRTRWCARARAAAPALRPDDWVVLIVTTTVATVTAWTVLGWGRVYAVPTGPVDLGSVTALAMWALVAGPMAASAAIALDAVARRAIARQPTGWVRLPLASTAAMGLVGLAAVWWPTLPGNGKGIIELTLSPLAGMRDGVLLTGAALAGWPAAGMFALLVVLKIALTGTCLRAGIVGGLLTPALAVGAALGAAVAVGASTIGAPASVPAWALVGAAGVLAVSHRSALFALAMVWELTGMPWTVALAAAAAGALARATAQAVGRWFA